MSQYTENKRKGISQGQCIKLLKRKPQAQSGVTFAKAQDTKPRFNT